MTVIRDLLTGMVYGSIAFALLVLFMVLVGWFLA